MAAPTSPVHLASRLMFGGLAGAVMLWGVWGARQYPMMTQAAPWLFMGLSLAFAAVGRHWPVLLLGLWPVAGAADWSGWLLVEEADFLLLACVAGWCMHRALREQLKGNEPAGGSSRQTQAPPVRSTGLVSVLAVGLLGGSALASWLSHGGWAEAAWNLPAAAHYHAPQAALRMLKPYAAVICLLLMLRADGRGDPRVACGLGGRLCWGMTLGLLVCALSVMVERYTYTGLLNFSSDYRVTGPFWEMHVGGAALDAHLALSVPFALACLLRARGAVLVLCSALCLAVGLYAVVASFSRATYASAAVSVVLVLLLWRVAHRRAAAPGGWAAGSVLLALAAGGGYLLFPIGGYRGLVTWLSCVALLPAAAYSLRTEHGPSTRTRTLAGLAVGVSTGALLAFALPGFDKGVYFGWAALAMMMVAVAVGSTEIRSRLTVARLAWLPVALWLALVTVSASVTLYWGGMDRAAMVMAVHAVLVVPAMLAAHFPSAPWPHGLGWQLRLLAALSVLPLAVGVVLGGGYMEGRTANTTQDWAYRMKHWNLALSVLNNQGDWLLGKGLSRFPQEYRLVMPAMPELIRPGHQEVLRVQGEPALKLIGAEPSMGHGEQHRVIQRVPSVAGAPGPFLLEAQVWAQDRPVRLQAELCGRHLLYVSGCASGSAQVVASADPKWVTVRLPLRGDTQAWSSGPFSSQPVLALVNLSGSAVIWARRVRLVDGAGVDHLVNGDFENGLERWFFTSDRSHLPWSAKNLTVHLLVEQGLVGTVAWAVVLTVAVLRALRGARAGSATHAALAAALCGVMVVGMVDSLNNHTRTLTLILLMIGSALLLARPRRVT